MNTSAVFKEDLHIDGQTNVHMPQGKATLNLLLVIAVLGTLLSVIFIAFISWIIFKCCIQPFWPYKRRRRNNLPDQVFPPAQRDVVEMTEIGSGQRSIMGRRNQGFLPDRSGISESLGYPRCDRKSLIPHLPPPKSWTPSPPFPPNGPLPPIYPPLHPNHPIVHTNLETLDSEEELMFQILQRKRNQSEANSTCHHCGNSKFCPVNLQSKLEKLESSLLEHSMKLNLRNFGENISHGTLRPPNNTPLRKQKINSRELRRNLKKNVIQEDPDYEEYIVDERNNARDITFQRNQSSLNLPSCSSSFFKNTKTTGSNLGQSHSGQFTSTAFRDSFWKKRSSISPSKRQSKETCVDESQMLKRPTNNTKMTSIRRHIPNYKRKRMFQKPRLEPVFIESPSTSYSSSTDLNTVLNRSSKDYWKIYHPPDGDGAIFYDERESNVDLPEGASNSKGDLKSYEDEMKSYEEGTPSMSWDHLTPDPSPLNDQNVDDISVKNKMEGVVSHILKVPVSLADSSAAVAMKDCDKKTTIADRKIISKRGAVSENDAETSKSSKNLRLPTVIHPLC